MTIQEWGCERCCWVSAKSELLSLNSELGGKAKALGGDWRVWLYTKEQLKADGKRSGKHSRTLGGNLEKAGFARPDHVCAHHIVARAEPDALPSRDLLYGWGIGINDADNGVFLPRYKDVKVDDLPRAIHHGTLHKSLVYCARVHRRLTNLPDGATQELGRKALLRMREEMTQGIFTYK